MPRLLKGLWLGLWPSEVWGQVVGTLSAADKNNIRESELLLIHFPAKDKEDPITIVFQGTKRACEAILFCQLRKDFIYDDCNNLEGVQIIVRRLKHNIAV